MAEFRSNKMEDLRLWSREMTRDLIKMYESFPCLWKVKSDEYKNRCMKMAAYKTLIQFCKNKGFHDATKDFVVRKIQSLRGSFRKELKKCNVHKRAGRIYNSNLWYFDLLLFTKNQEVDDGNQSVDETCHSAGEGYDFDDEKFLVEEKLAVNVDNADYTADSPQSSSSPVPKSRNISTEDFPQPEFFDIGQDTSKFKDSSRFKDVSEYELAGMNIAKKLARMDPIQAIYAESIINNVIRRGLLKKLKEDTDLCDNMCGKRILSLNNLPS